MRLRASGGLLLIAFGLGGCLSPEPEPCDPTARAGDLVINEVVSNNEGVFVDETGALEDYIEIANPGDKARSLEKFVVKHKQGTAHLPSLKVPAGGRVLIWADGDLEQGPAHADFGVSAKGETLSLRTCGETIDKVEVAELADNESFSRFPDQDGDFAICRYATPNKSNGKKCQPPPAAGVEDDVVFADYVWPGPHPKLAQPLAISEVALRPADFVELENTSDDEVSLAGYSLRLAPIRPGVPMPTADDGVALALDEELVLAPGELVTFPVTSEDVSELELDPAFEGVLSLFDADGNAVDRWDFMRYPEGASLARVLPGKSLALFCDASSPGEPNDCNVLASREVGDRVRGLRTLGDFAALAEGGTALDLREVKFVVDVAQDRAVHFLSTKAWALHYTFIREVIDGDPPLDRCDPIQSAEFNQGWYDFSVDEYFKPEGRHFFLGTLAHHGSTGHHTVEFAVGDTIAAEDMAAAFFTVTAHLPDAESYLIRPQDDSQIARAQSVEGDVPILPPNAPFRDLVYQPLTLGEGYGLLTFVSAAELESTPLGAQVILVTDDVPNNIPLVGGLITEAFQTPLAHVNLLSQNRGTPNMALRSATSDPRISENLGKLVRLSVAGDDFTISPASAEEVAAFWAERQPTGPKVAPRLDTSVRELVDLKEASIEWVPVVGAKAAQLAELMKVNEARPEFCAGLPGFFVPGKPFAIPLVHFLEHFEKSGANARLAEAQADPKFASDALFRGEELALVRELIQGEPLDAELRAEIEQQARARYGTAPFRFRSSSNAEDLPGFNGAGLYLSVSAAVDDKARTIDEGLRAVWASLYDERAFDERELSRVDHSKVAMGVLVHPSFPEEAANGVALSRNLLDPTRGDMYYLNAQVGEASVTNPAPGVTTESLTLQLPPRTPLLSYQSQSSLLDGGHVLSEEEAKQVACALYQVHSHFRPLLDPDEEDPRFTMQIEFKFLQPDRSLLVKQARPSTISGFDFSSDCREF